jgi:general stress protein CsbA
MFFNQNVGDGANLFLIIIAVIVGFVAGLSYVDKLKTEKEQEKKH